MKKFIKPNFEFIFSVSLIAILGLPPLVLAQNQKSIEIKIVNNDTTVNGKDIKKLSVQERKEALAEMSNLPQTPLFNNNGGNTNNRIVIKRKSTGEGKNNNIVIERSIDNDNPVIADFDSNDSARKDVRIRLKRLKGADSVQAFTYRFDSELPPMEMKSFSFDMPKRGAHFEFNNRNSQAFNYSNIDADGISTNVSFKVSDASKEKLRAIAHTEKAVLVINDINLSFEFSSGKTAMTFNLPAKTATDIKFTNTEGAIIWADRTATGSFSKKFSLPLNGVYYLHVKQGDKIALKKIVKE
jgi:hypothetical protein